MDELDFASRLGKVPDRERSAEQRERMERVIGNMKLLDTLGYYDIVLAFWKKRGKSP